MRIIGLLSWYEEPAAWLAECVAAAAQLCDHLVAVDGPYALFPGALRKPASEPGQADVIARTAAGAGVGCTVHVPREPWWGGEVAKRDFMFRLGSTFAEPGRDWFLRVDADEVLTVSGEPRKTLATTALDVAEVLLWERGDADSQTPLRALFRALPGIGVQQAHYVVAAPGEGPAWRVLAGDPAVHRIEPAETVWDVRLEHRTRQRPEARRRLKDDYYRALPDIEQVREL